MWVRGWLLTKQIHWLCLIHQQSCHDESMDTSKAFMVSELSWVEAPEYDLSPEVFQASLEAYFGCEHAVEVAPLGRWFDCPPAQRCLQNSVRAVEGGTEAPAGQRATAAAAALVRRCVRPLGNSSSFSEHIYRHIWICHWVSPELNYLKNIRV